jgi:hypothetical protein
MEKRVDREGTRAGQIYNKYRFNSAKWLALLAERGNMDNLMLPDLIIWNNTSFLRFRYNEVTYTYEENGDLITLSRMDLSPQFREEFSVISGIYSGAGGIYLSYVANWMDFESKRLLLKLGPDQDCLKSRTFDSLGAVVTDGQNIIVAAEGDLIVMDENLEDIGKVQLEIPNWGGEEKKCS